MEDLKRLIKEIRDFTYTERNSNENLKGLDVFFISMLEISVCLVELGVYQRREITEQEQENWFQGDYHLDFWDSDVNKKLYKPLVSRVKELNYFREK